MSFEELLFDDFESVLKFFFADTELLRNLPSKVNTLI
jgi:hypothetical protein